MCGTFRVKRVSCAVAVFHLLECLCTATYEAPPDALDLTPLDIPELRFCVLQGTSTLAYLCRQAFTIQHLHQVCSCSNDDDNAQYPMPDFVLCPKRVCIAVLNMI